MGRSKKTKNPPESKTKTPALENPLAQPLSLKPLEEKSPIAAAAKVTGVISTPRAPFIARAQTKPLDVESSAAASPRPSAPEKASDAGPSEHPDSVVKGGIPTAKEAIPSTRKILARWMRMRVRLLPAALAFLAFLFLTAWAVSSWTASAERKKIFSEISKQGAEISTENQDRLDQALMTLRNGDSQKALDQLVALEHEAPEAASLAYLVAVAAMQAGQSEMSAHYADKSIARRERVSDALAIKAVLETQSASSGFGDPKLRAEGYLRQAMVADAANASPLVELASLLRYRKQNDEAMSVLQAARSRLNPVDSHTVVDTSIALLSLQEKADADLPADLDPDKDTPALFSSAYIAMRRGDFARAATLLKTARNRLPADLYYYLVNDPALRKYVRENELKGLYE